MKMVKKISVLTSALVLAAGFGVAQAADAPQLKVAVVNVQQVLQQSPRVADLSKKLENQFKARQTKIGDGQKALQDAMDKLIECIQDPQSSVRSSACKALGTFANFNTLSKSIQFAQILCRWWFWWRSALFAVHILFAENELWSVPSGNPAAVE